MSPGADVPTPADRWGRVDQDGTVYVRTGDGERPIGSWQAGSPAEGLEHYRRRYDDLVTEVELLEQRLVAASGDPVATGRTAKSLRESLPSAAVLGDLDLLGRRLRALEGAAGARAEERAAARAGAKAKAVAAKEALIGEAEAIAGRDSDWKAGGDRLRAIVEEWREIHGVDRRKDEAMWKRFRGARDAFTRKRGAHFAALGAEREAVKERKEALIRRAETLAESTEWGPTADHLKGLMREWKEAGRSAKNVDDLWKRFRAAQDAFFARRTDALRARDDEESVNLRSREALIARVEALEVGDRAGAEAALGHLQEEYDATGAVPRSTARELDERMRAAEQGVRDRLRGRTRPKPAPNPLLDGMREAVEKAESALARAEAAGVRTRVQAAEEALSARRQWLTDAERSAGG